MSFYDKRFKHNDGVVNIAIFFAQFYIIDIVIFKIVSVSHDIGKDLKGSMTVEMSFLMPVILLLIMSGILGAFYFHDKNILAGAAYETAIVGSTKIREKDHITVGELESLYQERTGRKCILFAGSSVRINIEKTQICVAASARKGHFGLSVIKKAAVTEPENYIRNIRKVKEIADGAKNHD